MFDSNVCVIGILRQLCRKVGMKSDFCLDNFCGFLVERNIKTFLFLFYPVIIQVILNGKSFLFQYLCLTLGTLFCLTLCWNVHSYQIFPRQSPEIVVNTAEMPCDQLLNDITIGLSDEADFLILQKGAKLDEIELNRLTVWWVDMIVICQNIFSVCTILYTDWLCEAHNEQTGSSGVDLSSVS